MIHSCLRAKIKKKSTPNNTLLHDVINNPQKLIAFSQHTLRDKQLRLIVVRLENNTTIYIYILTPCVDCAL